MKKGAHERAPPPAGPPEASEVYLRLAADFDNFRRRTRRDAEQQAAAEKDAFIRELLPVLDSLDRARAVEPAGSLAALHQGVEQTWQQLDQLLRRHGIEAVDAAGLPFDTLCHEAVSVGRDPHQPDQVVLEVAARGYRRGDQVFRHAKVIVNDLSDPPGSRHAG